MVRKVLVLLFFNALKAILIKSEALITFDYS